ncbi:hypothetical protein CL634_00735 [bacterium]|nr:hypothetical protein [bacterium]|tara:strand:- start:3576 stop:4259 length:684 start_codon:yes stop_codon:yes gene_type:complete
MTRKNMNSRQQELLHNLIEYYITTAMPVGSGVLASDQHVSSATVRNELAELEHLGYLVQPYTSAGRIPTEKAYQEYFEALERKPLAAKFQKGLVAKDLTERDHLKDFAKKLAETSATAVFVAFSNNDVFHTGLSNLFSQPEFSQPEMITNISQVVDRLEDVIFEIFKTINEVQVQIGSDNPFGNDCTVILTGFMINNTPHVIGLLGPMRMDYQKNIALIEYIKEQLT